MQKKIGFSLIAIGLLAIFFIVFLRIREIEAINIIIAKNDGSCYLDDGTCLHDTHSVWPYVLAGTIMVIVICIGIYLVFQGRVEVEKIPLRKKVLLDGDEKIVYDKIIGAEGTVFQSELVERTGMTKVKITRILDKLEGKGIIERKRRGMTNVVILK
ncbi:MAG: MarR family transcriptional regulator [Candidatus Woesearchaeota archaeon]|nr:MarR family transcriptional regulator [Candidatus Woesearchaeota archaeon]